VIEVWIENTWLVEVLPPTFAAEYLGFADAVTQLADPNTALDSHQPQARTLERGGPRTAGRLAVWRWLRPGVGPIRAKDAGSPRRDP
jgi:hypothetical protein